MNDDEMLTAVRGSLTDVKDSLIDVRMDQPAGAIVARARRRRLGRGLSGVGAASLALGVGLAVAFSGGQPSVQPVHVNLDAWSVDSTSSGRVTVTIHELRDPTLLGRTLAAAGIPAIVTTGRLCGTGKSLPGTSVILARGDGKAGGTVLIINPTAMPTGSELTLGTTSAGSRAPAVLWALVSKDGAVTCAQARLKTEG
jgi:hypothetical protein